MSESIYINYPALTLAFLLDISFIFIYSFINIKYYKGKIFTILIGVAGFVGSVLLEGITITIISKILGKDSPVIIGLSLLFPGLFEETGRYICLKYLYKNDKDKLISIGYGIGHGGIEAFIVGLSLLQFVFAKELLIEQGILKQDMTFLMFFMGVFERFFCVFVQISFSVLVFKAVKENNINFYILAIFLHDAIDFFAFLYQKQMLSNIYVIELIIGILSLIFARYAYKLYINIPNDEDKKKEESKEHIPLTDKKEEDK